MDFREHKNLPASPSVTHLPGACCGDSVTNAISFVTPPLLQRQREPATFLFPWCCWNPSTCDSYRGITIGLKENCHKMPHGIFDNYDSNS